jgi:hypothetical protein
MGTLHEDVFTFMTISGWILLRMRTVSDKNCRKNHNIHFMFSDFFPKIVPLKKQCRKIWRRKKSQNDKMVALCLLYKWRYTRAQAHTSARATTHPPPHTHTHKHIRQSFATATMISWQRLSVTLYVRCLPCSFFTKIFFSRVTFPCNKTFNPF